MALDFGSLRADLPVRLQVGDGDLVEVGTVTLTTADDGTVDQRPIADLLRAAADEIENPTEDDSAASR